MDILVYMVFSRAFVVPLIDYWKSVYVIAFQVVQTSRTPKAWIASKSFSLLDHCTLFCMHHWLFQYDPGGPGYILLSSEDKVS